MDTLKFLEQMAESVHHGDLNAILKFQSSELIHAYQTNNANTIKKMFGEVEFVANPSDVVQITLE